MTERNVIENLKPTVESIEDDMKLLNMSDSEIKSVVDPPQQTYKNWIVPCRWRDGKYDIYDGDTAKIIFRDPTQGNKIRIMPFRMARYDSEEMKQPKKDLYGEDIPEDIREKKKQLAVKHRNELKLKLLDPTIITVAKIQHIEQKYKRLIGEVYMLPKEEAISQWPNIEHMLTDDRSISTYMLSSGNGYAYTGGKKKAFDI